MTDRDVNGGEQKTVGACDGNIHIERERRELIFVITLKRFQPGNRDHILMNTLYNRTF